MTGVWCRLAGVLATALAVALASCGSDGMSQLRLAPEDRPNVFPTNYRTEMVAGMRSYLTDPTNIRDASVSEPVLAEVGRQRRYSACVRFSARDAQGRYTERRVLGIFSSGRFDQFFELSDSTDTAVREAMTKIMTERCGAVEYRRFPELEVIKR